MSQKISIGSQDFAFLREQNCFLIDKTGFIKSWWESGDAVTLITRPRRFGKTLNMSMLNCFFSLQYQNRGDLFEGLSVWSDPEYQKIQGTYPVIYLMEETVQTALEQIEKKQYDAELLARGIEKERIRHYGFAFEGKQVLIG